MISGYLLLDREYDYERTRRFWKNNWLHLLVCTEIWFVSYEIFLKVFFKRPLGIVQVIEDLLFVHGIKMSHVWYMPMILGMYVLIPFVANALQALDVKILLFPVGFFTLFAFGYPFFSIVNHVLGREALSFQMSLGFSGGVYGLYFVFGYLIKKGIFKRIKNALLITISCFSLFGCVVLQGWAYNNGYQYTIWYDCPFILFCSLALMELFSRISRVPGYRIIRLLSKYSFAVYLVHDMIRLLLIKKYLH